MVFWDKQDALLANQVLPKLNLSGLAIEAGVTDYWRKA
jgi:hypothetical protein